MNTYESNIDSWLNDEDLLTTIENKDRSYPDHHYPVSNIQTSLSGSIKLFNYLKKIIQQAIDNGVFEKLPIPMQLKLNNIVQAVYQHRTNPDQFIVNIQNLQQEVIISGIEYNLKSYDRFKDPLTQIASLKRTYSSTLKNLKSLTEKVETIESNYNASIELIDNINEQKESIDLKFGQAEEKLTKTDKIYEEINEAKQEIENSKKDIIAFKNNIDSYKADIEENTQESGKIVSDFEQKRKIVDKLISDSEKALGLKSTEGISAALSVQYEKEDNPDKIKQWLTSAIVFLIISFIGVALLIIKFNIGDKEIAADSVNAIIARIVFVAIAIGGASFSAKQYLRQKNLADNYGYKLVLAKSIVAFAHEIKKYDPKKAVEYLNNVLDEINKSPIASSKGDTEGLNTKNINLIEKIIDLFKSK